MLPSDMRRRHLTQDQYEMQQASAYVKARAPASFRYGSAVLLAVLIALLAGVLVIGGGGFIWLFANAATG